MAQEHDLFDDIIEISKGFDFLKNPLGGVRMATGGTKKAPWRHEKGCLAERGGHYFWGPIGRG